MLHGVQISNGKATYRNRYVQTAGWKKEREAGKARTPYLGICASLLALSDRNGENLL